MSVLAGIARFPRVRLGHAPTPIYPAPNLGAALGIDLWIKRDDCTGIAFGGNKVRQLEFHFGEARARGADTVLVTGAVQSNLVRIAAARKLGMAVHIQLEDRVADGSETYRTSGNLLLDRVLGATLHAFPEGEDEAAADAAMERRAEMLAAEGRRPYVIHSAPGHAALGELGYVLAAEEIAEQAAGTGFDAVVCASGRASRPGRSRRAPEKPSSVYSASSRVLPGRRAHATTRAANRWCRALPMRRSSPLQTHSGRSSQRCHVSPADHCFRVACFQSSQGRAEVADPVLLEGRDDGVECFVQLSEFRRRESLGQTEGLDDGDAERCQRRINSIGYVEVSFVSQENRSGDIRLPPAGILQTDREHRRYRGLSGPLCVTRLRPSEKLRANHAGVSGHKKLRKSEWCAVEQPAGLLRREGADVRAGGVEHIDGATGLMVVKTTRRNRTTVWISRFGWQVHRIVRNGLE